MVCPSQLLSLADKGWKAGHSRTRLAGDQGSEIIEVAIVLPLYFMFIFGLTSFATVLFAYCNAIYAAKTAVRYAVLHGTATMAPYSQTVIQGIVAPFLWGAPTCGGCVTVAVSPITPPVALGTAVTVTVTLRYSTGLPYVNLSSLVVTAIGNGVMLH